MPSQAVCWTSIAAVVWDDLEPEKLTAEQQQALVDWLHWGGRLIVSGPGSLDTLKNSFLAKYLPCTGGDSWSLTANSLQRMNDNWSRGKAYLKPLGAWSGQHLLPKPEAHVLLTADDGADPLPLVVEGRVGRGNVVVSAFRLTQRELVQWPGCDEFFNACLLRRAARRFFRDLEDNLSITWEEPPLGARNDDDLPEQYPLDPRHPRQISALRYFTRDTDLPHSEAERRYQVPAEEPLWRSESPFVNFRQQHVLGEDAATEGYDWDQPQYYGGGVAAWNDFNVVAALARQSLTGGIVIPKADFIVWMLGLYLTLLVPVNWAFFRLLGRVEWAWLAAPVITLGFSVAVVRMAQLDVGFVRTRSEIGVVEMQGDYPRAHVTRYTSLYTSLSTDYRLDFDDATAVAQPFPASLDEPLKLQSPDQVRYRREPGIAATSTGQGQTAASSTEGNLRVGLDNFQVRSNSQAMLHSEQILDLAGSFRLERGPDGSEQLVNDTPLELQGCLIVSPRQVAWVGNLAADAVVPLTWRERSSQSWPEGWDNDPTTQSSPAPDALSLRKLLHLALHSGGSDEWRLIGWTDEALPGLEITPAASQSRQANLVVAHLRYEPLRAPRRDTSSRLELKQLKPLEDPDNM